MSPQLNLPRLKVTGVLGLIIKQGQNVVLTSTYLCIKFSTQNNTKGSDNCDSITDS